MSGMPLKTAVSDVYPNPDNATANAGFGALWDVVNEFTEKVELDVASAATVNIGGQLSTKLRITGTTTITSFGTTYRGPILIRFAAALTLTHNATTLILPDGANLSVAAGDACIASPKATTSGTFDGWIVRNFARATMASFSTISCFQSFPGVSVLTGYAGLTNVGACFNTTTGLFTAPVAGQYLFGWSCNGSSAAAGENPITALRTPSGDFGRASVITSLSGNQSAGATYLLTLAAGATVGIVCSSSGHVAGTDYFWGRQLT